MQVLSLLFRTRLPKTQTIIPTNEKKWITIHAHSGRGTDLAMFVSKTVTTMLRHFDQDERETDGSRHWESIKSILVRKFAREGARDFSDETRLQKIFEGSSKKIVEYSKNEDGIFMLFTSYSRAFWWYSNRAGINGLCINSSNFGKVHFPHSTFMELSVYIGKWSDSRRKRER